MKRICGVDKLLKSKKLFNIYTFIQEHINSVTYLPQEIETFRFRGL